MTRFISRFLGFAVVGIALIAGGGCSTAFLSSGDAPRSMETAVQASDLNSHESRTRSHLAAIESALSDYIKSERMIPSSLEMLVPKYLAEIPTVELGVRGHGETSAVLYYPSDVISAGVVDGSRIKDTGKWGYVHNKSQVIIFVDCTHRSLRGKPWYRERGVF